MSGDPANREQQPRMVALLLGPTGVGKTLLGKILAELLFGDQSKYHRIDGASLAQAHQADRLTGSPPGFRDHDAGGQLTGIVRREPFSVILFDEAEKADPAAFERMMSVIDDGRLTDGQGEVAYFGECVFLITANIGAEQLRRRAAGKPVGDTIEASLAGMSPDEVTATLRDAARDHFDGIGRPELWGRLAQSTVAFQPLRPPAVAAITEQVVTSACFLHGPEVKVDLPSAVDRMQQVMADPAMANLGGRQIRNQTRNDLLRLAAWTVLNGHMDAGKLFVSFGPDGEMFVSVDGDTTVSVPVDPTEQIRQDNKEAAP